MNTKIDKEKEVEVGSKVPIGDKVTEAIPVPKMRQIIVETDGNIINLKLAEVSGRIELTAILQNLINFINQPNQSNGLQSNSRENK